jgi:RNA polymerase-binding transcription factor DksA
MAKKKPAPKAAKPAKKAAPKKAVKKPAPAKKAAPKKAAAKSKPAPKKAAPKKAAAPVKKAAPKKAVKAAPKAPAKKQAPVKKAAAPVKKAAPKAPAKPAPKAPVKAAAPVKQAPRPAVAKAPAEKPAAAPRPVAKSAAKAPVKKEDPKPSKPLVTQISAPVMPKAQPMVKKHVSTLEAGNKDRYSDGELEEFKGIIMAKLDEARKDYDLLKQTLANTDNNGTDDTSPSFKMIEDGSETLSREETAQLAARQEKFIKHLEDALLRIRNKTYGICRVTGKLISKERLRLVPHATLSIEAKQQMNN